MKSKRSFGVDGISSYFLKIAAPVISKSLAKIFNKSLLVGSFPEGWKVSKVAPIFKAGVKSEMGNYRPISVLSTVAGVFERLVYDQLSYFMEQHEYLLQYQPGFRKFHSTITAMLKNSNHWLLNMNKGLYNGVVFFYIKKAFDTVGHDILLSKLSKYGVIGIEFEWFMSYLTDRKQSCTLSGETSSVKIVKCGIPQGSCLGPPLFLIYINDLPSVLGRAKSSMFADDIIMWVASDIVPERLHLLRDEITLLEKWMWDNKLTLNTLKTEFILKSSIPKLREIEETCCIHIQGESIYQSPNTKSLGFYIDQHLDWEDHINHVIKKASAGVAIHRATSRYLSMNALQIIYRSLVESHIRPPKYEYQTIDEIETLLKSLDAEDKEIILMGDVNCSDLDIEGKNRILVSLRNMYHTYQLKQLIKFPTRSTLSSQTLIDHFTTNKSKFITESTGFSDHDLVFSIPKISTRINREPKVVKTRQLKSYNPEKFRQNLEQVNWKNILKLSDVNEMSLEWEKPFISILDWHAPYRQHKVRNTYVPCIDKELKHKMFLRDLYKKRFNKSKSHED